MDKREEEVRAAVAELHETSQGSTLDAEDINAYIRLEAALLSASKVISALETEQKRIEKKIIAGMTGAHDPEELIEDEDPKCEDLSHIYHTKEHYVEVVYGQVRTDDANLLWCEKNPEPEPEEALLKPK